MLFYLTTNFKIFIFNKSTIYENLEMFGPR